MRKLINVIASFATLVIFFLLPFGALMVWDVPDRFDICAVSPHVLSFQYGRDADGGVDEGFTIERTRSSLASEREQIVYVYYPHDTDFSGLRVRVIGDVGGLDIKYGEVFSHGILRKRVGLKKIGGDAGSLVFAVDEDDLKGFPRVVLPTKLAVALAVAFVGLFLLVYAVQFLKKAAYTLGERIAPSVVVAFLGSAFVVLALPVQSYLVNASMFEFPLGDLVLEQGLVALAVFVWLAAGLFVSTFFFGRFLHVVVLFALICAYLETGVLASGLPPLNGDAWIFRDPARIRTDSLVLGGVMLLGLLSYKYSRRYVVHISAALGVMILASMFDVKKDKLSGEKNYLSPGCCAKLDAVRNAVFSASRNVLVLMLDSTPADVAGVVARENPELMARFTGFVGYDKNCGVHGDTLHGLPGTATGLYFDGKSETIAQYSNSIFSEKSFLADYVKAGCSVSFLPNLGNLGYSSEHKPTGRVQTADDDDSLCVLRPTTVTFGMNLFQIVRFRLAPFFLKAEILNMTSVGGSACARFKSEKEVYPILERAKIDRAIPLSLGFYHTEGCHFPITIDRYGNQLKEPRNDYQGIIDETTYLMTVVADFLDTLRSRGLYDNSAIIITADHGTFHGSMDKKLPARVSTLLWVKPERATEPYRASSLPTSSQKISVLAKALLAGPLNQAAIDGILEAHDRVYIGTKEYHGEFFKYVIDDDNNVVSCEALGFSD